MNSANLTSTSRRFRIGAKLPRFAGSRAEPGHERAWIWPRGALGPVQQEIVAQMRSQALQMSKSASKLFEASVSLAMDASDGDLDHLRRQALQFAKLADAFGEIVQPVLDALAADAEFETRVAGPLPDPDAIRATARTGELLRAMANVLRASTPGGELLRRLGSLVPEAAGVLLAAGDRMTQLSRELAEWADDLLDTAEAMKGQAAAQETGWVTAEDARRRAGLG